MSKDECRETCLSEKTCVEAFYVDLSGYSSVRTCVMYTDLQPCVSYGSGSWADAVQWRVTTKLDSPTKPPTPSPTRAQTLSPSNYPTDSFCSSSEYLHANFVVSYSCVVNNQSIGDFLDGSTTSTTCANSGGVWTPYTCQNAQDYWKSLTGTFVFFNKTFFQNVILDV